MPDNLLENYLFHIQSLQSLLQSKNQGLSKTTLYRKIRKLASNTPSWEELARKHEGKAWGGVVMGIDTTSLKIRGVPFVYVHVVDVQNKDPLAYDLCMTEDAASVERVLRILKDAGYNPELVISDLAPELLIAIKRVFPDAKIQGCLFHLRKLLDKKLPTKKVPKLDRKVVELWRKAKHLIMLAACSKDAETRRHCIEQLNSLTADEKVREVVKEFLVNISYYYTLDELKKYGFKVPYNNLCERQIGLIKSLKRKMIGFKSIEATRTFINSYWFAKRKPIEVAVEKDEDLTYKIPLLIGERLNLRELSEVNGIPQKVLNEIAKKLGYIVIGNYALTEEELKGLEKRLQSVNETTLAEITQKLGYDDETTLKVLRKFAFEVSYNSIDPSRVKVYRAGHE